MWRFETYFKVQSHQINPPYNPNSKVSRFLWRPFLPWQVGQFSWENTFPSIPPRHHRNTAKTPRKHPKHEQNTQNITEHCQDTTLRTHHQSATKTPTTTETKLTDHQDTSTKDATNSQKDLQRVFPRKLLPTYFFMIFFPHHHLLASPSTQHCHNNLVTAPSPSPPPPPSSSSSSSSSWSPSSFHQPCPHQKSSTSSTTKTKTKTTS